MAALIAGVLWRAGRPSELAYRHTRTHRPGTQPLYSYPQPVTLAIRDVVDAARDADMSHRSRGAAVHSHVIDARKPTRLVYRNSCPAATASREGSQKYSTRTLEALASDARAYDARRSRRSRVGGRGLRRARLDLPLADVAVAHVLDLEPKSFLLARERRLVNFQPFLERSLALVPGLLVRVDGRRDGAGRPSEGVKLAACYSTENIFAGAAAQRVAQSQ